MNTRHAGSERVRRGTVHVVDDDDSFRRSAHRLLTAVGLEVELYASAAEFIARRDPAPGCLLLDVHMPGAGGFDLHDQLAEAGRSLPVVFISGDAHSDVIARAARAGAVAVLSKPVAAVDLVTAIDRALTAAGGP